MRTIVKSLAIMTVLMAVAIPATAQQTVTVYITNLSKQIISPPGLRSRWQAVR